MSEPTKERAALTGSEDWELEWSDCNHIAIISISPTECQCMDCLRIWPKEPDFVSDWPEYDRG